MHGEALEPNPRNNASAASDLVVMAGANRSSISGVVSSDDQGNAVKRNATIAGLDSSPGSIDDLDEAETRDGKKRQPVKRACNECRQQKVGFLSEQFGQPADLVVAASVRCGPGPLHGLLEVSPPETRLQNRIQL